MTNDVDRMPRDNDGQADTPPRLLMVDDEPRLVNALSSFLTLEGYRVDRAADELQAVIMLAATPYDLVLTGVNKFRTHWRQLLWTIRNRYPNVVVVVITEYEMIENAKEAVKMGAFGYLVKPIIDDEIRVTIQQAIKQRTLSSENDRPLRGVATCN